MYGILENMRKGIIFLFISTGFLFLTLEVFAEELVIDPSCGEVGHAPCVPGLNAPLPPKKTFDYVRVGADPSRLAQGEAGTLNEHADIPLLDESYAVKLGDSVEYPVEVIAKRLDYSDAQKASEVYSMERKLILRAYEDPDLIGDLSKDVFEIALKRDGVPLEKPVKPVTVILPWPGETYMKKVIHVWNGVKNEWEPLPSVSDFEEQTVSARWPLPYGQFVVFDSHEVFEGVASWYSYKGCNCAAIKEYKRGVKFRVTNITNGSPRYGRSVAVTINDYGPAVWTRRAIDLDKVAFRQIANTWNGLAVVRVEKIN